MNVTVTINGMPVGLGWRSDLEDKRFLVRMSSPLVFTSAFAEPEEVDPRDGVEVNQQGGMGRCSGESQAAVGERLNKLATGGVVQLSPMYSYLMGQMADGLLGQDNGATISGSIKGAMRDGYCTHEKFPSPSRYTSKVPPEARSEGQLHKLKKFVRLRDYSECQQWLASGVGAIQIGIAWTQSCVDCNGLLERQAGAVYGGHALAVLGYSKRRDSQGRKFLWMLNSHGREWGQGGWAEVAPVLFDKWGRDGESELIGGSDLETFTPRDPTFKGVW